MAVKLRVDIDLQGQNNTTKAFRAVASAAEGLASKITAVSTAYEAFGKKLEAIFLGPLKDAAEAERINNRLATSLDILGRSTSGTMKQIEAFADEMKRLAGVEDEAVKQIIGTNVAMGMTVEQAEATSEAAVKLAKFMGVDLVQANQSLTRTLAGSARELKAQLPELAGYSEAQLRQGAAIDFVSAKLNKFLTSDAATTLGAFQRLKVQIEDVFKAMAEGFLTGVNLGGNFNMLSGMVEQFRLAAERTKPAIESLARQMTKDFVDVLKFVASNFEAIVKAVSLVLTGFERLSSVVNILTVPLNHVAILALKIANGFGAIGSAAKSLMSGDFATLGEIWQQYSADQAEYNLMIDENAKFFGEQTRALLGYADKAEEAGDRITTAAAKASGRKAGSINLGMTDEQKQYQLQLNRQLEEQILALKYEFGNKVELEHDQRLAKIRDMELDAAKKGVDISKNAAELKAAIDKSYLRKLDDFAREQELHAAQAAGNTIKIIELQYQEELRLLKEKLENQFILQEEFEAAVSEAQRKRAKAEANTAGSVALDEALGSATQLVGAVQGGISGIISSIGAMFGPIGMLVASIVNLLNQTPEQFREMVQGLIKAVIQLPRYIAANIPILIAEVVKSLPELLMASIEATFTNLPIIFVNAISAALEVLPAALGRIFSFGFWVGIAKSAFNALKMAFQNLFSILFTGKAINSALSGATQTVKREAAKFGSDDPNAGGGEFKIKDASLRAQRRATQNFEETFAETVDQGGKSFNQLLKEAWDNIIKTLGAWFEALPGKLWNGLLSFVEGMKQFGAKVWEGLMNAIVAAWEWIKSIGAAIWNGFVNSVKAVWDWLKSIGQAMGEGFRAFISTLWEFFKDIGRVAASGVQESLRNAWDFFRNIGMRIWDGLWEGFVNFGSTFSNAGKAIWNALRDGFTIDGRTFSNAGTAIWNALRDGVKNIGTFGADIATGLWNKFVSLKPVNLGSDMAVGLWNKLINLDVTKIGSDMAVGLWNRIIKFDWKGLIPGLGGGGGGGGLFGQGGILGTGISLNKGGYVNPGMANPNLARAWAAMGAMRFASGGNVPGTGFSDTVPAVLTPGERVLSRAEVAKGVGNTMVMNFNFNVATGAKLDKEAIRQAMPQIVEQIRRESRNGNIIAFSNGVA